MKKNGYNILALIILSTVCVNILILSAYDSSAWGSLVDDILLVSFIIILNFVYIMRRYIFDIKEDERVLKIRNRIYELQTYVIGMLAVILFLSGGENALLLLAIIFTPALFESAAAFVIRFIPDL